MMKQKNNDICTVDQDALESTKRDEQYSKLLKSIINQVKADQVMKVIFFAITLIILISVCGFAAYVLILVLSNSSDGIADIAACVGAFGAIISSIITLPTIIANHLFPQNREEIRLNFMKDIKRFDMESETVKSGSQITEFMNDISEDSSEGDNL